MNEKIKNDPFKQALYASSAYMEKHIGPPPAGFYDTESPGSTLWNVYNLLEVVTTAMADRETDCIDRGMKCLIEECKAVISYEAQRLCEFPELLAKANSGT